MTQPGVRAEGVHFSVASMPLLDSKWISGHPQGLKMSNVRDTKTHTSALEWTSRRHIIGHPESLNDSNVNTQMDTEWRSGHPQSLKKSNIRDNTTQQVSIRVDTRKTYNWTP